MAGVTYTVVAPSNAALPPPPGIIPDFQDPYTLRPYNNVATSLGLIVAGTFVLLRMFTKLRVIRECKWEDCECPFLL